HLFVLVRGHRIRVFLRVFTHISLRKKGHRVLIRTIPQTVGSAGRCVPCGTPHFNLLFPMTTVNMAITGKRLRFLIFFTVSVPALMQRHFPFLTYLDPRTYGGHISPVLSVCILIFGDSTPLDFIGFTGTPFLKMAPNFDFYFFGGYFLVCAIIIAQIAKQRFLLSREAAPVSFQTQLPSRFIRL
ncbi:MAG: hypothetical protein IJK89_10570, partial [Clostridia bacterium]|nr:hypothetical protein [Clostridia bacterium]